MTERVRFTLGGRHVEADAGASLLAALWNHGARAVRTSVQGEARGPLCAMGTCFECRVSVDGEPHVRACLTPVREGMAVALEPMAPSGRAASDQHATAVDAQVVVVGGGPAGLAAAVHAAEAGARTLLVDTNARPGGQIWRHRGEPPRAALPWLVRFARSGASAVAGASVVDATDRELLLEDAGGPRSVHYERLVLATGARELFLPFPGWTLPGVVGVGAAQALLKAGARFRGRRVLVAGSGPLLPAVAVALAKDGARIVELVEQAPRARLAGFAAGLWRAPRKVAEGLAFAARLAGVPYRTSAWIQEVAARDGALRARVGDGRHTWTSDCDVVACGFGLVPNLELPRLLGCQTDDARVVTDALQRTSVPSVFAAGELGGIAGVDHALATGAIAGLAAAGREVPASFARRAQRERDFGNRLARAFALREELRRLAKPDTLVCRCEDVAVRRCEGASSSREAKLATRAGMGACQGRVCGPALRFLHGWPPDSARPPLSPASLAALMQASDPASPRP
jgi:NADPH-dependent 2,4-dienoyl-CoA reductase/sulfur reductase-like enzyme